MYSTSALSHTTATTTRNTTTRSAPDRLAQGHSRDARDAEDAEGDGDSKEEEEEQEEEEEEEKRAEADGRRGRAAAAGKRLISGAVDEAIGEGHDGPARVKGPSQHSGQGTAPRGAAAHLMRNGCGKAAERRRGGERGERRGQRASDAAAGLRSFGHSTTRPFSAQLSSAQPPSHVPRRRTGGA